MSNEVLDVIDSKMSYKSSVKDNTTILPIFEDDKNTYYSELIYPITIQGDKEGVIILCQIKNEIEFDLEHLTTLKLVSKFLSKQLE